MKNPKIRAVASYEPGLFIFPEGEVPPPMPSASPFGELKAAGVPSAEFMKLTKIPIVLYFGDYIPDEPSKDPGLDNWRVRKQMAKLWVDADKQARRRRDARGPPQNGDSRQHALHVCRPKQCPHCRTAGRISERERLGQMRRDTFIRSLSYAALCARRGRGPAFLKRSIRFH